MALDEELSWTDDQDNKIQLAVSIEPTEIPSDLTLTLTFTPVDDSIIASEIVSDILLVLPYTGTW
ncbi:hypothetical protein IH992_18245 [Candidatus Poribacteria bacterium]|nr:hypothetical protein [Candidatus Poribacteria bacterium]